MARRLLILFQIFASAMAYAQSLDGIKGFDMNGAPQANAQITMENAFRFNKRAIVVFADCHVGTVPATKFVQTGKQNAAPWMTDWRNSGVGSCPQEDCPLFPTGPGTCFDPARLP